MVALLFKPNIRRAKIGRIPSAALSNSSHVTSPKHMPHTPLLLAERRRLVGGRSMIFPVRTEQGGGSQDDTHPHTGIHMAPSLQTLSVSMVTGAAMKRGGCGRKRWVGGGWSVGFSERHLLDCDV